MTLDTDDTCDGVHGHQQLSLLNAHYDERCFLPIHVYDTERSRPVAVVWRQGKTPSGFVSRKVEDTADAVRTERAAGDKPVVRDYTETRHEAGYWTRERRAVARIEATRSNLDFRFVVTNVEHGSPEWVYDSLYYARGQAENLIKMHKAQLRSDRTLRDSALANQVRHVFTPPPTGSCWTSGTPFPRSATWPRPSSRRCASACSRSPPGSWKPATACLPPSRPPVPRRV